MLLGTFAWFQSLDGIVLVLWQRHLWLRDVAIIVSQLLHGGAREHLMGQGLSLELGYDAGLHLVQLRDDKAVFEALGSLLFSLQDSQRQVRIGLQDLASYLIKSAWAWDADKLNLSQLSASSVVWKSLHSDEFHLELLQVLE